MMLWICFESEPAETSSVHACTFCTVPVNHIHDMTDQITCMFLVMV